MADNRLSQRERCFYKSFYGSCDLTFHILNLISKYASTNKVVGFHFKILKLEKSEYLRTLCGKALKNLVWVER